MADRRARIDSLISAIPNLTDGQLYWLNGVIDIFNCPHQFEVFTSDLIDDNSLRDFGDALRIHHSFSAESFSKDKFEYVLEKTLKMNGRIATLSGRGRRGYDIMIDGVKVSLKTQADKEIKKDKIWISKIRELGSGVWGDNPDDLIGLRQMFLDHMQDYERIFTLRTLSRAPNWHYELVEIPKALLALAEFGELEMKINSTQLPKPGYCFVRGEDGKLLFQLYFDAGGERKLQLQHLQKNECVVHASWKFTVGEELA